MRGEGSFGLGAAKAGAEACGQRSGIHLAPHHAREVERDDGAVRAPVGVHAADDAGSSPERDNRDALGCAQFEDASDLLGA